MTIVLILGGTDVKFTEHHLSHSSQQMVTGVSNSSSSNNSQSNSKSINKEVIIKPVVIVIVVTVITVAAVKKWTALHYVQQLLLVQLRRKAEKAFF